MGGAKSGCFSEEDEEEKLGKRTQSDATHYAPGADKVALHQPIAARRARALMRFNFNEDESSDDEEVDIAAVEGTGSLAPCPTMPSSAIGLSLSSSSCGSADAHQLQASFKRVHLKLRGKDSCGPEKRRTRQIHVPWTFAEDQMLLEELSSQKKGNAAMDWKGLAARLPERTKEAVRRRVSTLQRMQSMEVVSASTNAPIVQELDSDPEDAAEDGWLDKTEHTDEHHGSVIDCRMRCRVQTPREIPAASSTPMPIVPASALPIVFATSVPRAAPWNELPQQHDVLALPAPPMPPRPQMPPPPLPPPPPPPPPPPQQENEVRAVLTAMRLEAYAAVLVDDLGYDDLVYMRTLSSAMLLTIATEHASFKPGHAARFAATFHDVAARVAPRRTGRFLPGRSAGALAPPPPV